MRDQPDQPDLVAAGLSARAAGVRASAARYTGGGPADDRLPATRRKETDPVNIAERAAAAHRAAQRHPADQPSAYDCDADVDRVARQLAALLGVDPHRVRPDRRRARLSLPLEPLTLHVADPDDPRRTYTFTYLDPAYHDEPFFVIGPCPRCSAGVPLAEIRTLADLGSFLAAGPQPLPLRHGGPPDGYPDAFDEHPAHTAACPYRESRRVGLMRRGRCPEAPDAEVRPAEAERVEIPFEHRFPWITAPAARPALRSHA